MPLKSHKVEILDSDDKAHHYHTTQYPGGESFQILLELMTIAGSAGGDVMEGVGSMFSVVELVSMAQGSLDLPKDALGVEQREEKTFNGKAFGNAVIDLVVEVKQAGGLEFIKRILQHTIRSADGKSENALLNCADHFDTIYQGNIGEAFEAVAWVLKENYGRTITRPFSKLLSDQGPTGMLGKLSQASSKK